MCREREILNVRMTELKQASSAHGSTDGQESKIEVGKESENNIEESDDEVFRNQLYYYLEEQLNEMLGNQLSDDYQSTMSRNQMMKFVSLSN